MLSSGDCKFFDYLLSSGDNRGIARSFQNEGAARGGGLRGERGADWDSKWWLSIDLCKKCNFIGARGGKEGGRVSVRGQLPPCPLATPLGDYNFIDYLLSSGDSRFIDYLIFSGESTILIITCYLQEIFPLFILVVCALVRFRNRIQFSQLVTFLYVASVQSQ